MGLAENAADAASAPWIGARDLAILLLLYGAGLRVAEALSLTARALPIGTTLRVTGKRSKTRIVPIVPAIREAVEDYVRQCPYPRSGDAPLFVGARGGPLASKTAETSSVPTPTRHAREVALFASGMADARVQPRVQVRLINAFDLTSQSSAMNVNFSTFSVRAHRYLALLVQLDSGGPSTGPKIIVSAFVSQELFPYAWLST